MRMHVCSVCEFCVDVCGLSLNAFVRFVCDVLCNTVWQC